MGNSKFKMPTKSDLKGRSSTISNAFAISITPYILPDDEEIPALYRSLEIEEGQCAYCLGNGNGRDHLKPLVRNGLPTGYITDINNLVPCCQACNSSKGSKDFKNWYMNEKNMQRLHSYGLTDEQISHRFKVICEYESRIEKPLDYESIVGHEKWAEYKARKKELIDQLNDNQNFCDELSSIIMAHLKES